MRKFLLIVTALALAAVVWSQNTGPNTGGGQTVAAGSGISVSTSGSTATVNWSVNGFQLLTNLVADYRSSTNGCITNSVHLYDATAPFSPADVGKEIDFNLGANQLSTTIAAYDSPTEVDLTATYGSTVNNVFYGLGHDQCAQINSQVSNAWTSGFNGTFLVPSGNYFLNAWTTLPMGTQAGGSVACMLWIPTTNVLFSQAPRTLCFIGQETPPSGLSGYFSNSSAVYGNQPVPTNGAIFNAILAPGQLGTGTVTNCIIGCPSSPANFLTAGFLNLNIVLQNLTFRTYNNPQFTAVDMGYVGQCSLQNVIVDNGTDQSYSANPTGTGCYAIRLPLINNYAGCFANNLVVAGYYNGVGISEHLQAGNIYAVCCNNGLRFLSGNHLNWIARFIDQGEPYGAYNSGAVNTTIIGEWDCESDVLTTGNAAVQAWQLRAGMLFDNSNDQYGTANFAAYQPSTATWVNATNVGGIHFNMPNSRNYLQTGTSQAQFSSLVVTSNALVSTSGVSSLSNNQQPPVSISVTASPFTYANASTNTQFVFIIGGTVSAVSINSTAIGTGTTMVPLQIGESVTVTYSAAPTMRWKPL